MYTIGMEEEYFVFDAQTRRAVRRADKKFLAARKNTRRPRDDRDAAVADRGGDAAMRQHGEARAHLAALSPHACGRRRAERELGVAAMGTFPLAFWPEQTVTPKARYGAIMDDLQMIGHRNMLCGMHVHVEVPDLDTRINLIMRLTPYLPLLLALSTSSPFWQGHLTGLRGYRLAAYDELPRTGLPELFRTNDDYRRIRRRAGRRRRSFRTRATSGGRCGRRCRNPTIELRVADSCTRLDDAVAIAALFRCLVRALDRDRALNAGFDRVGRAITAGEQMACAALRHRRHLRRSVLARSRSPPGMARCRCATSSPRTSPRSVAAAEIAHLDAIVDGRHQRRPPDRDLHASRAPPAGKG